MACWLAAQDHVAFQVVDANFDGHMDSGSVYFAGNQPLSRTKMEKDVTHMWKTLLFYAVGFGFLSWLIFLVLSVLLDPVGVAVYLLFALPGIIIGCAYGLYCALSDRPGGGKN